MVSIIGKSIPVCVLLLLLLGSVKADLVVIGGGATDTHTPSAFNNTALDNAM